MMTIDKLLSGHSCRKCHLPVVGTGGYNHRDCLVGAKRLVNQLVAALREHEEKSANKKLREQIRVVREERDVAVRQEQEATVKMRDAMQELARIRDAVTGGES